MYLKKHFHFNENYTTDTKHCRNEHLQRHLLWSGHHRRLRTWQRERPLWLSARLLEFPHPSLCGDLTGGTLVNPRGCLQPLMMARVKSQSGMWGRRMRARTRVKPSTTRAASSPSQTPFSLSVVSVIIIALIWTSLPSLTQSLLSVM